MHRSRILIPAALALLLTLAVGTAWAAGRPFVRGHVLVQFRQGTQPADHGRALAHANAASSRRLGTLDVEMISLAPGQDEQAAVTALKADPNVVFAELDELVPAAAVPNDPGYASQWFLPDIACPSAWNYTVGTTKTVVAVLDSGCDPTHPDLAAKYVPGWNFIDNNSDTHDIYGHGTAVAGCVGASGNNGTGIASVNWNCLLMPIRIAYLDSSGNCYGSWSAIASGINYAADHGCRVANLSYGVYGGATVQTACQYMWNKGGLVVFAGGNGGAYHSDADNPYAISVAPTDSSGQRCSWGDYGPYIDVAAPGSSIYTTCNGGGYGYWSGTSFAAPITAGVLALAMDANPALTNQQVQSVLFGTCTPVSGQTTWNQYTGWGKLNAYQAVLAAAGTQAPTVSITAPSTGTTLVGSVTVNADATDAAGIARVEFYLDGTLLSTATAAPYTAPWDTSRSANGSHSLMAKAYDPSNNVGTSSTVSVTVSNSAAPDTTPPTCQITSPANNTLVRNGFTVNVTATDNVAVAAVSLYVDGSLAATDSSAPYSFSLNAKKWPAGGHTIVAIARDKAGNASAQSSVTVRH